MLVHEHEAEGPAQPGEELESRLLRGLLRIGREEGRDEGGVGRVAASELTGDPAVTEVLVDHGPELDSVDEVAVVPERDGPVG